MSDIDQVFQNGVPISSTPRVVPPAELERREDGPQMRQALTLLRQWAQDAEVVANQGANVSQAQMKALFDRFGKLCRLQVRVIRRVGEDDGL